MSPVSSKRQARLSYGQAEGNSQRLCASGSCGSCGWVGRAGKHWIIKNRHGPDWGENGYFRVPLNCDEDGITSLTTAAKPVLGNAEFSSLEEAKEAKRLGLVSAVVEEEEYSY